MSFFFGVAKVEKYLILFLAWVKEKTQKDATIIILMEFIL